MKTLPADVLFQIGAGSSNYKIDYTIYACNIHRFNKIQVFVHQLENNEITIDEFFNLAEPYTCYRHSEWNLFEIHISS